MPLLPVLSLPEVEKMFIGVKFQKESDPSQKILREDPYEIAIFILPALEWELPTR
jgi:hypothetical protein